MASYRRPRGIYVRNTPDWFYRRMAVAGFEIAVNSGNLGNATIGLFNNDSIGRALHVYGLSAGFSGGNNVLILMEPQARGTAQAAGSGIDPRAGAMPGVVNTTSGASIPTPMFVGIQPNTVAVAALTAGQYYALTPFPQFLIPPGYQLTFIGDYASSQVSGAWWYIPLAD